MTAYYEARTKGELESRRTLTSARFRFSRARRPGLRGQEEKRSPPHRAQKFCLLLAWSATLLGCANPPSDEDVRDAERAELLRMRFISQGSMARVNATRILACAKSELGSCLCDIDIPGKGVKTIRMARLAEGWAKVKV